MTPFNTQIVLHGLELHVYLGWPKAEQIQQQWVAVDITLFFPKPPLACHTDQLKDTVCYAHLVEEVKMKMGTRIFRLIEHLAYEIHGIVKQCLPADFQVAIQVTKKPAIADLTGGVSFYYSDKK